ncbi:hypothetical protein PR048_014615 [Dryococelus australis]|uniref:Uncharacterized protein n=1 Tax=Dryococelus australis TaxID=614101 RepID=A0ABQ9HF48_9NEOP|nr:hypothetical protein PR048_014615 [Dryococelus australis]
MFNFCKSNIMGIIFFYLNENYIKITASHFHDRFENAQQVPKTRQKHSFDATLANLPIDVPVVKEKAYIACVHISQDVSGEKYLE